jgi:hypothetical protein
MRFFAFEEGDQFRWLHVKLLEPNSHVATARLAGARANVQMETRRIAIVKRIENFQGSGVRRSRQNRVGGPYPSTTGRWL